MKALKNDSVTKYELSDRYPDCMIFVNGAPVGCCNGFGGKYNFCVNRRDPSKDCPDLWPDKYQDNVIDKANGGDGRVHICLFVSTSIGLCNYILETLMARRTISGWNANTKR